MNTTLVPDIVNLEAAARSVLPNVSMEAEPFHIGFWARRANLPMPVPPAAPAPFVPGKEGAMEWALAHEAYLQLSAAAEGWRQADSRACVQACA